MKRFLFLLILFITLIFTTISIAQTQETLPRFEYSKCPIEVPSNETIDCGFLITQEDYKNLEGSVIRTPVIIIRSRKPYTSKEALLFTEGGPGFSSLRSVWWLANTEFANKRDIVILEQRGNEFSEPRLACDFSVWWNEVEGQTDCLNSMRKNEIMLENYTTESIAADINALKQVLDYERWILFGTSYSSRPIQLVMKSYPEKVYGVILHSTSPITDTRYLHDTEHTFRVLQVMFNDCTADSSCASAYPNLENQLFDLVHEFNNNPIELEIKFPKNMERSTIEVDGNTLISWMVEGAFYGPAYPPFETSYLPLLIDTLSSGNMDLIVSWAENHIANWSNEAFSWGLYFAINCQDDASSINPEIVENLAKEYPQLDGFVRHREELDICTAWGLDSAPRLATEPITSKIPTLILAGTYDPITPPEWSQTAIINLINSTFVEFLSSGHSVIRNNPCAEQIIATFMDNPSKKPDLRCMETVPKPKFILPDEIIIAPSIYEIHYGEIGFSMLEERLFLGSIFTIAGTGFVILISSLSKLVCQHKPLSKDVFERMAPFLFVIYSIIVLGWGYAFRFSLRSVADTTPIVLRFGLPVTYWWIFFIVILISLLTILLIATALLAWKRGYWSLFVRIAFSLTILAAIVFVSMLAYWGLLSVPFV